MTTVLAFIGAPGVPETIVIVLGLLLLFGGKKIPELMRGLGSGMREFKKASTTDEIEEPRKEPGRIEETNSQKSVSS